MSLGSVPIGVDPIGREGMVNAAHVRRDVFVGCSIGPGPKPGGVCRLLATASAEVPLGSQAQAPGACLARSSRKRLAAHTQQRSDRRVKPDRRTSVSHTARHGTHGRILVCHTSCLRSARPRLRTYGVRYVRRTRRSHCVVTLWHDLVRAWESSRQAADGKTSDRADLGGHEHRR